mmetsp:Transcript_82531/g.228951  ORF Transcript_82531/g.228951 Transcript_82531/m.228951 type:complete len:216 (-) Transcript_82531:324-971(-)
MSRPSAASSRCPQSSRCPAVTYGARAGVSSPTCRRKRSTSGGGNWRRRRSSSQSCPRRSSPPSPCRLLRQQHICAKCLLALAAASSQACWMQLSAPRWRPSGSRTCSGSSLAGRRPPSLRPWRECGARAAERGRRRGSRPWAARAAPLSGACRMVPSRGPRACIRRCGARLRHSSMCRRRTWLSAWMSFSGTQPMPNRPPRTCSGCTWTRTTALA